MPRWPLRVVCFTEGEALNGQHRGRRHAVELSWNILAKLPGRLETGLVVSMREEAAACAGP